MLGGGASFGGTQGKADTRAAWCEREKAISVRKSPLQGSCDFSLIECISEGLQAHTALDFVTFLLQGWDKALENSVVHKLQT